jgi:hypothetical protein
MKTKDIVAEGIEKHVLSLIACRKSFDLGGFAIQNLTVNETRSLWDQHILYTLSTLIPAEKMKEESHTFEAKHPRDWKQAFKEQHFPMWLKRRYPVKYVKILEKVKFTAYNLYPRFPAVYPDMAKEGIQHIITEYECDRDTEEKRGEER